MSYYLGYLLGVVPAYDGDTGSVRLFTADAAALFPGSVPGALDLSAFHPAGEFSFPVASRASQVHLVTDSTGQHFLLAYRASKDDETGDDFVDVHPVSFEPFTVSPAIASVHIFLRPGKTSFANTGTHYVDRKGRLLISSSYRWAEDEGPGDSGFVSRVDECPS